VNSERLAIALERVREKIAAKAALLTQEQFTAVLSGLRNSGEQSPSYLFRFLVKDGEKDILLPVEKIDWIEAAEYYCCLHTNGHRYMVRETITDLGNKLDPRHFIRIHLSVIVNLNQIREIYREGPLDSSVVLLNGQTVRLSKAGRQKLNEIGKSRADEPFSSESRPVAHPFARGMASVLHPTRDAAYCAARGRLETNAGEGHQTGQSTGCITGLSGENHEQTYQGR
jgi:hypothetical protein